MPKISNDKAVEEAIKEVLSEAPKLKGYAPKDLKLKIPVYWPFRRCHLEFIEAPRDSNEEIGSSSLYKKFKAMSKS